MLLVAVIQCIELRYSVSTVSNRTLYRTCIEQRFSSATKDNELICTKNASDWSPGTAEKTWESSWPGLFNGFGPSTLARMASLLGCIYMPLNLWFFQHLPKRQLYRTQNPNPEKFDTYIHSKQMHPLVRGCQHTVSGIGFFIACMEKCVVLWCNG